MTRPTRAAPEAGAAARQAYDLVITPTRRKRGRTYTKRSETVLTHATRVTHADQGFRSFPQVGAKVPILPGSQEVRGSNPLGSTREPKVNGVAAIELPCLCPNTWRAGGGA